jgi:hypothetical protein
LLEYHYEKNNPKHFGGGDVVGGPSKGGSFGFSRIR